MGLWMRKADLKTLVKYISKTEKCFQGIIVVCAKLTDLAGKHATEPDGISLMKLN